MFPDAFVTLDVTHEKETERGKPVNWQRERSQSLINAGHSHKRTCMYVLTLVKDGMIIIIIITLQCHVSTVAQRGHSKQILH